MEKIICNRPGRISFKVVKFDHFKIGIIKNTLRLTNRLHSFLTSEKSSEVQTHLILHPGNYFLCATRYCLLNSQNSEPVIFDSCICLANPHHN